MPRYIDTENTRAGETCPEYTQDNDYYYEQELIYEFSDPIQREFEELDKEWERYQILKKKLEEDRINSIEYTQYENPKRVKYPKYDPIEEFPIVKIESSQPKTYTKKNLKMNRFDTFEFVETFDKPQLIRENYGVFNKDEIPVKPVEPVVAPVKPVEPVVSPVKPVEPVEPVVAPIKPVEPVKKTNQKTRMCKYFLVKKCNYSNCNYAHGYDELTPFECRFDRKCKKDDCTYFHPAKESKKEWVTRTH